ncbi:MAG: hypothetical protein A2W00_03680 [Candidatus Eisenbacteria bacterium RBG_16_71_46]|nr:MAG: hypothetical protein A2W00_03680 [Candidatus Eisenbacteria bacterium RBG_16_71_46]OGF22542.1 MAG: hypothetical protein A2V63_10235 [Candidatus Eisenbacteria bacterium RBG_19FT_COMBO_70_11]
MAITDVFKRALAGELGLSRGRVVAIESDGRVRVRIGAGRGPDVPCEVLQTGTTAAARLTVGSDVLVACPEEPGRPGVILGTVGSAEAVADAPGAAAAPASEPMRLVHRDIVIEAGEELTLRCGEASIKIRRDGKIVIRGEHILSRAKGTQRIKGGSVAIN